MSENEDAVAGPSYGGDSPAASVNGNKGNPGRAHDYSGAGAQSQKRAIYTTCRLINVKL